MDLVFQLPLADSDGCITEHFSGNRIFFDLIALGSLLTIT